ncbi:MAG: AraC family transcriptional regulator [Scytolyngbya sp. HA4215-MV1]|nr:AraC family transcriptional regulator [Scytolyngbya sp. HA4215-MV1]
MNTELSCASSFKADLSSIKAWTFQDSLFELYQYAPGPPEVLPKHSHDEYQFCLSFEAPGEYWYQGSRLPVPPTSLSLIHPGEIHAARDVEDRLSVATFRMLYVAPALLENVATTIAAHPAPLPFFASPIVLDPSLARQFLELHLATETAASTLEQESQLLSVLTQFILRHAEPLSPKPVKQAPLQVQRVREYLRENLSENVSLDRLAQITDLNPYYLHRVFCRAVGIPPHRYQTQLRIDRAKLLLAQGGSIADVAAAVGFADQSHLTRQFKSLVRFTPGSYVSR